MNGVRWLVTGGGLQAPPSLPPSFDHQLHLIIDDQQHIIQHQHQNSRPKLDHDCRQRIHLPRALQTFEGFWDDSTTTARQLAAIGHVSERPPLEVLEQGSRCVLCSAFVKKEDSMRAFGDASTQNYQDDFRGFTFHKPECKRLQIRIPLEPQALLGGLHGTRIESLRSRFEKRPPPREPPASIPRAAQTTSRLLALPTELRLQIYALVLPQFDPTTEITTLHRDSPRVITRAGHDKTTPQDKTKPNILRTCSTIYAEATDLLYTHTTFRFTSKIMYLFLRSIGTSGRRLITSVDVHCGSREDAVAFSLLASCEKLRAMTIRLGRPNILPSTRPLWVTEGMAVLLALSGLQRVEFGWCESSFGCMDGGREDARVIRRELMRERGTGGSLRTVDGQLDV